MADFILRNVDARLWATFKARVESEGRTMRWVIVELLTRYIKHGLPKGR